MLIRLSNLLDGNDSRLLVRVPQFDRDWITLLKVERKIEWRSDSVYYVEYPYEMLTSELSAAG